MSSSSTETLLAEALDLLVSALELIDRSEAAGDIGAHVDHAAERIRDILGMPSGPAKDLSLT